MNARFRTAALVVAVSAAAQSACARLLAIEDFPVFRDGGSVGGDGADERVTADCEVTPCAPGCHAFCDDFEGADLTRWVPPLGLPASTIVTAASQVRVASAGSDSAHALEVRAANDAGIGVAFLAGAVDAGAVDDRFDGIRLAFDLRLDDLAPGVGSTVPSLEGGVMVAGLASQTAEGQLKGAGGALYVTTSSFYLVAATDLFDPATATVAPVDPFVRASSATTTWIRWTIFVGTPARAALLGVTGCPTAPLVVAAMLGAVVPTCVAIDLAADGGAVRWPRPIVVVGSRVQDGSLVYRVDNVLVDTFVR